MNVSYEQASRGHLPDKTPCEVYCHTLTDDSILAPELREKGFHTMTLFGLDTPWSLFARDNKTMRQRAEKKFVEGLNGWRSRSKIVSPSRAMAVSASKAKVRSTSRTRSDCTMATFFRTRPRFLLRRPKNSLASGASRRSLKMFFSAARARCAAAQSVAFPGTMPRRRSEKQEGG